MGHLKKGCVMLPARLHDLFMLQAVRSPNSTALIHAGEFYSYAEIDRRSNQLARCLWARGAAQGARIGLCLERSSDLIVALIAILKAGCAYVPLDPLYPPDRLSFILADSEVSLLITRGDLAASIHYTGTIFDIAAEVHSIASSPDEALPELTDAADLACVLYTSGSTGRPKGVMLRHTATGMVAWAAKMFPNGELACIAATTSICFDPSIFEIFAPLSTGGTILLKKDLLDPFTQDECPTMLNGVPSAFAELARTNRIPASVQVVNIGGERLRAELAREIYRKSQVEQIWNHYGPTETTICASVSLVPCDAKTDPPIGQAMAGSILYVLDEDGHPVGDGCTGELFIGGSGLAQGYLNLPQLTAAHFLPDPFKGSGRMYRTGDLVRRAENGDLFFVGRRGRQVKFRGFRIELDEIETALLQLHGIKEAALVPVEHDGAIVGLLAAITTKNDWNLASVRRALRDVLPAYMLPTKLAVLAAMPLNQSGKIDFQAISSIAASLPKEDGAPEAKMSPVEEVIVNVYRDVLQQSGIGLESDFFDEGGDSLLAIAAAERLEALLGQTVPVTILYHGRTAEKLAQLIGSEKKSNEHLVVLQSGGDGTSLFCLPDIYGRPTSFISLARYFEGKRPVYGLAPGPLESDIIAQPSIERLTRAYRQEIKKIQPHGPYYIVGYSAGGIPAIDLACTLEQGGDQVTLILIDPRAQRFVADMRDISLQMRQAFRTYRSSGLRAGLSDLLRHHLPDWVPAAYADLAQALLLAEAAWRPRFFKGRTIMAFCPQQQGFKGAYIAAWSRFMAKAPRGWRSYLSGSYEVKKFSASHYQIMRDPFVESVAFWLSAEIDNATV